MYENTDYFRLHIHSYAWPWANYLHLCASVTKRTNLVGAVTGALTLFGWERNCRCSGK